MGKIIIDNQTELSMDAVLPYVGRVIEERGAEAEYRFVTTWSDGVVVYARRNERSDRFVVTREGYIAT